MPFLSGAQNFAITGGSFTDITNSSGPTGIDILREASSPEAAHDSDARAYPPRCFPGTREQYIEDIVHWAVPALNDTPAPIYWMKGPAGVGKSAIAQTCTEKLKYQGNLGVAFFFSIKRRDKPERLFPSIAYQLSTIHPAYRDLLDKKIRHDKTLVKKAMPFQFRYLIDEPLRELEMHGKGIGKRIAVIIDGLDECEGADTQCEIIRIIAAAVSDGTAPLCWAFFSRPEPHIEAMFAETAIASHCHKVELPFSRDTNGEIELYLKNGFGNILRRCNVSMQSPWPSTEDMRTVVGAACGSFIYATTVLRFVGHLDPLGPPNRLRAIIGVILYRRKHDPRAGTSTDAPFAELDGFYTLILQRIPEEIFPSVHLLLALLCRMGFPSVVLAANLLALSKHEFETICSHANAVVHVKNVNKDIKLDPAIDTSCMYTRSSGHVVADIAEQIDYLRGEVSFYHKSFDDFLLDPARSGDYCVKGSEALAMRLLKIHHDYDRSFCWQGSELVLAPDVPDSASSLSYPYSNELVNSLTKAIVYMGVGNEDSESFSAPKELGRLDADRDFRKHLHVYTHFGSLVNMRPSGHLLWGCECLTKWCPRTLVTQISRSKFPNFNATEFKSMIKQRQQANIIRRYHPNLTSRIKPLFRNKPRKQFESGLYRMGHGEKSVFWYWEIDFEFQYYREFRAIDLAEGERIYQAEDFNSWCR